MTFSAKTKCFHFSAKLFSSETAERNRPNHIRIIVKWSFGGRVCLSSWLPFSSFGVCDTDSCDCQNAQTKLSLNTWIEHCLSAQYKYRDRVWPHKPFYLGVFWTHVHLARYKLKLSKMAWRDDIVCRPTKKQPFAVASFEIRLCWQCLKMDCLQLFLPSKSHLPSLNLLLLPCLIAL